MGNDGNADLAMVAGGARPAPRRNQVKKVTVVVPADWRSRATITVPEYAEIVGVARNTAYDAAAAGEVHTIKLGCRILVSVPALLKQLEGRD